jgi:hypothetical protein
MSQGREQTHAAAFGLAADGQDAPATQLGLAAIGGHCVNCGATLASDQRYCVNCGERRGKPRFALAEPATQVTETVTAPPRPPRRVRASSGFTLIAGIATLLIAMGVGVLIGHNSSNSGNQRAAVSQPLKITLNGTGAGAGTGTTPAASAPSSGSIKKSKAKVKITAKQNKALNAKPTAAQNAKASSAANKVLGGSAATAPPTVTQGSTCQNGTAGCQNGHFTGNNFFGQ